MVGSADPDRIEIIPVDADGDPILYVFEWYESKDGVEWTRRPELSGNAPPYYDRGEPEISELYTSLVQAGEYWKVEVTPIDIPNEKVLTLESSMGHLSPLVEKSARNSQTGSAEVLVLPDLDGDNAAGPCDLILLQSAWHKSGEEMNETLRQVLFDPEGDGATRVGPEDLYRLLMGWNQTIWR